MHANTIPTGTECRPQDRARAEVNLPRILVMAFMTSRIDAVGATEPEPPKEPLVKVTSSFPKDRLCEVRFLSHSPHALAWG
jgi:hypothetical protein